MGGEETMNYSIFLSHHETETALAERIREFLKSVSQVIEVHTYVQKAKADTDYRRWVHEAVGPSDMFMFLYTDDTRELSWVAHELGLYFGTHQEMIGEREQHPPVICIKSNDIVKMPEVMSNIAPISATEDEIAKLLENLLSYGKYSKKIRLANDTLNPGELQQKINAEATVLAGMFRSKIHTQYFADRLIFRNIRAVPRAEFHEQIIPDNQAVRHVYNPDCNSDEEYILDFSKTIIETNDNVRRILQIPDDCCWNDIVRKAKHTNEAGPSDRFNLAQEILRHASSERFKDAASMMLAEVEIDGVILIPIISRVEKRDRLPITYYLLMIPDPRSRHDEIGSEERLAGAFAKDLKLVLLLSVARRFRWNVIEPFIWKILKGINSSDDLRSVFNQLRTALDDIEKENEQDKLDDGNLASLYFPEKYRKDLKDLWIKYAQLRVDLNRSIDDENTQAVLEVLNEFQKMNRSFMETALEVYKQTMIELPILDEAWEGWRERFFS
jgi:hypothetical protein